ncbi:periplasmic chaperone for outer membrane proteins SurA [Mariprofundus ferrinatatus]|uniref:Chaperone SurA n=1 Tax=Mariprofundus ferrinatatus TaxID=1921087 RepID=A0A2K8L895_9PROT|nr:peptidylprolyl isomerase [Mariprofundus ferrinatatus]ATX81154.1 periplasmic chaperone for outer membrane proteins SurA [Mariprofundus ferrinatatus]
MRFTLLLTAMLMTFSAAKAETFDAIAALINNEAISCYQIESEADNMLRQMKANGVDQQMPRSEIFKRILDNKITKALQLQEAARLELSVGSDEVAQAVQNVEQANNLAPGQLKEALALQGVDFETYQEELRDQILTGKLINIAVRSNVSISEEALKEYHRKYFAKPVPRREVQVAQIFLPLPSEPTPAELAEVRNRAIEIHAQLSAGKPFGKIAALFSASQEAGQDGIMGWFMESGIAQRFSPVLELPVGAITQPIRSPSGFHILKAVQERWKEPAISGESYDEVHARHILLQIPSFSDDKTRAKIFDRAERIASDMKNASDEEFAERAKEISQGPSSGKGGDLGWFRRGMMVPEFETAAFALEAGGTSGVVESSFGLHIIRTVAKRHVDPHSLEAHRDNITEILTNVEMQERLPRWIASLKSKATIEIRECTDTQ